MKLSLKFTISLTRNQAEPEPVHEREVDMFPQAEANPVDDGWRPYFQPTENHD